MKILLKYLPNSQLVELEKVKILGCGKNWQKGGWGQRAGEWVRDVCETIAQDKSGGTSN